MSGDTGKRTLLPHRSAGISQSMWTVGYSMFVVAEGREHEVRFVHGGKGNLEELFEEVDASCDFLEAHAIAAYSRFLQSSDSGKFWSLLIARTVDVSSPDFRDTLLALAETGIPAAMLAADTARQMVDARRAPENSTRVYSQGKREQVPLALIIAMVLALGIVAGRSW